MSTTDRRQSPSGSESSAHSVLVAYATRFGSTRGVAERIAFILERGGHDVSLCPCEDIADAGAYRAVVFGSPVFNQRWLPEADEFIQRNVRALASRPMWLFTVGSFGDDRPVIGSLMRHEPRNIETVRESVKPRRYRVFAGAIDRSQWPFLSRLFFHALGGRFGDNRDWPAIEAWAESIAQGLSQAVPTAASS